MKTIKKLIFIILTGLIVLSGLSVSEEETAQAGTQTFTFPDMDIPVPCNLINGSFEDPVISKSLLYINESNVPGWETTPTNYQYEVNQVDGYQTIEFWSSLLAKWGSPSSMVDGTQCTELNAEDMLMRIYQTVPTTPGARIVWSYWHITRVYDEADRATTYDQINMYVRPGGNPTAIPTSSQILSTSSANGASWVNHRGIYTVPTGQTSTEISFHSLSMNEWVGRGNLIDFVVFRTGSFLILEQSIETSAADNATAYKGETVTVTVEITNWGENDANYCLFNDVISDGLEYIQGSAQIDGVAAGDLEYYNPDTEVLNIRYGTDATSTAGGIQRGSAWYGTNTTTGKGQTITITYQALVTEDPGYIVKNQAFVRYSDCDFESYGTYRSYSYVEGETPVQSDETTYVNQFVIIGREINGTAWYDSNSDGMIDTGETMASGVTVGIYSTTDTTYTTPINDVSGNPLTTTTDINGEYSFSEVPTGTYKVVATTPNGYFVTLKTVSTDNDASAEGTNAVTDAVSMTAALSIFNTLQSEEDVDFGFAPLLAIGKDAQVNGGTVSNGTAATPVNVVEDDTITYTFTIEETETVSGVTITDEIPEGLSLVTTSGTYTSGMTWSTDVGGITTVSWTNQTLLAGTNTYYFQVTVDALDTGSSGMTYINTATLSTAAGSNSSNSTYHSYNSADLTLSKLVSGSMADINESFTFTVNLTGVTGTLSYVGTSTISGVAAPADGTITNGSTVTLEHGQSITIEDVPLGTVYSITESSGDYTQTVTNNNSSGTLSEDTSVEFINTKNYVPPTGIANDIVKQLMIGIIALIGLGITAYTVRKRRLRNG